MANVFLYNLQANYSFHSVSSENVSSIHITSLETTDIKNTASGNMYFILYFSKFITLIDIAAEI